MQDVAIAMWQADEIPTDRGEARRALLRRVARIALRARRHAQRADARLVEIEEAEVIDPQDVEAWVEARALVLDALDVLNEKTRALLVAHDLEGRSIAELAEELGEKEDAIESQVSRGRERLRAEIERLLEGKPRKKTHQRNRSRAVVVPLGLAGLDPTDRAILCAVLDTERRIPPLGGPPPPASGVFALVGGAGTLLGPVLAAVAAVLGTVAALLLVASSLPRLQPDVGFSMGCGTAVAQFNATTTTAVGAAALVVAPPRAAVPPVQAPVPVPWSVARPPVSPEELAAQVAALRTVNVGRPPP